MKSDANTCKGSYETRDIKENNRADRQVEYLKGCVDTKGERAYEVIKGGTQ